MSLGLFDQFMSPSLMGLPLIVPALILPWMLFFPPHSRWLNGRFSTLQGWFISQFARQLLMPLNKGGHKWAVVLTSLMLYLLTMNMLGLLPYTFTPTTQLSFNLGFAVPLWMATMIIGLRDRPTTTLGHLLPEGTPQPLIPMLIIIETISMWIRPLALGVRLTANLTAGHLLIQLVSTAVFTLLTTASLTAVLALVALLLLTTLEVAVAMIQAYVFILLLSLYLQENV
uniref:ATP synthase subunit a n=1 Tax=Saccopharynx lavenbergi TaxID=136490 RepID=Q76MH5_9TELE|nr:ATPase subunits 6 [Saccopharynx lavenbergi]